MSVETSALLFWLTSHDSCEDKTPVVMLDSLVLLFPGSEQ